MYLAAIVLYVVRGIYGVSRILESLTVTACGTRALPARERIRQGRTPAAAGMLIFMGNALQRLNKQ
jgi:hypothetical protein